MYTDIRPASLARVIVGFLPMFDNNAEAAIRAVFDTQMLDPGIRFSKSYLDDIAIACNELHPAIPPSEWIAALYKVSDERRLRVRAIPAQAAIPKWAGGAIVLLVGLLLLSKKRK